MAEKLKPCPFCGGDVKIINAEELTINHHRSGGERGMNHDATHCYDYKANKCPKKCYRAQLTKDLRERHDLFFLPISWTNFKGTNECPLTKEVE